MIFEGKLTKEGKFWIAEISAFDLMTQGSSLAKAMAMVEDIINEMAEEYGLNEIPLNYGISHEITRGRISELDFGVIPKGQVATHQMVAFSIRRLREKSGLSIREVAVKLGYSSHNGYAKYETGKHGIGLDLCEKFLQALNNFSEGIKADSAVRIIIGKSAVT